MRSQLKRLRALEVRLANCETASMQSAAKQHPGHTDEELLEIMKILYEVGALETVLRGQGADEEFIALAHRVAANEVQ